MNQVSRQGIKCIFAVYKYFKSINSRNKQVFMWNLKQSYKLKANKNVTQVCRRNVFPWIIVSSNYFDMKYLVVFLCIPKVLISIGPLGNRGAK